MVNPYVVAFALCIVGGKLRGFLVGVLVAVFVALVKLAVLPVERGNLFPPVLCAEVRANVRVVLVVRSQIVGCGFLSVWALCSFLFSSSHTLKFSAL